MNSTVTLSFEDFMNYPHGLAYVSSVDGRGNFIAFGLFKKHGSGRNGNRRTYSLVGLLCFVGGEFRDGFVQEEIPENEVLCLVKNYIQIVHRSIPLVKVPAEEAASFVISFCIEKSSKKKIEISDDEIQKGVEMFKRAAKYSCYKDNADYLIRKLGKTRKEPKYCRLDYKRREFQSWWIEGPEMEHNKCPPLPPMENVLSDPLYVHSMTKPVEEWKENIAELMSTEENYDRFSGMSRHMGFWYMNRKTQNLKLAATMLQYYDRILEWKRNGIKLDVQSPVIQLVLSMTLLKLKEQGWCVGKPQLPISLCTNRKTCNICLAPVQKGEANNDFTCINKQQKECFGDNTLREVLSVIFDDVKIFGLPREAMEAVKQVIWKGLLTFFVHCFTTHLYWKETPTRSIIDKLVESCSLNLQRSLLKDNSVDWIKETHADIQIQMRTICGNKLSENSISLVSKHFLESCESIGPKHEKYDCLKHNQGKVIAVKAFVMEPFVGAHLKQRWKFMSERRRKDLLECSMEMMNTAIWGTYKEATLLFVKRLESEQKLMARQKGENDENMEYLTTSTQKQIMKKVCQMHGCDNANCACHNFSKFRQFFLTNLPIINSWEKSFLFWKVDDDAVGDASGKLVFNYNIFLENENDRLSDIISGDDRSVFDDIEKNCEAVNNSCSRLASLTETTYYRIFLALKSKIIQRYGDVVLLEEYNPLSKQYYRPTCAGCQWEENSSDRFMMCGGCKRVYYCSKGCQRLHWKAGHRDSCQRVNKKEAEQN